MQKINQNGEQERKEKQDASPVYTEVVSTSRLVWQSLLGMWSMYYHTWCSVLGDSAVSFWAQMNTQVKALSAESLGNTGWRAKILVRGHHPPLGQPQLTVQSGLACGEASWAPPALSVLECRSLWT